MGLGGEGKGKGKERNECYKTGSVSQMLSGVIGLPEGPQVTVMCYVVLKTGLV